MSFVGLLLLLLLLPVLGGYPICRAFEDGLEAARDPANRTTPESPWHFFRRAAWRRLRRWVILWAFAVLIIFVIAGAIGGVRFAPMFAVASFVSFLAALLLFQGSCCWLLSPMVRSIGGLVAGGFLLSAVLAQGIWIAFTFLPEPIGRWSYTVTTNNGMGVASATHTHSLGPFWALLVALIVYLSMRRRARRMGDAWFRFEE